MASEKKSILEIVLMPLVIALVGVMSTWAITLVQQENSERQIIAQLESAEKIAEGNLKVKALEIFKENIFDEDAQKRKIAISMLSSLDPELGLSISTAIAENEEEQAEIRALAGKAAEEIQERATKLETYEIRRCKYFGLKCWYETITREVPQANNKLNKD